MYTISRGKSLDLFFVTITACYVIFGKWLCEKNIPTHAEKLYLKRFAVSPEIAEKL